MDVLTKKELRQQIKWLKIVRTSLQKEAAGLAADCEKWSALRQLTEEEKQRIATIQDGIKKGKRRKMKVECWDATFFLRIFKRMGAIQ